MNAGTRVQGEFIVDSRFIKNTDLKTAIAVQRDSMKAAIAGEGIEIKQLGIERPLYWKDGTAQIRQIFELILTERRTKDQVYDVVNQVRAQPLKFSRQKTTK